MSEEIIVRHCSPTLAGIKTGNMFSHIFRDDKDMRDSVRRWNRTLGKKGLRVLPLRFRDNRGLIYVYRPAKLSKDLQHSMACKLLRERGYDLQTCQRCIVQLMKRMDENEEFPHEIGLFLGYPPEDVWGFIEKRDEECKCIGCWKVYKDEKVAKKTFEKYKKCTDVYCAQLANGSSIEWLTVAG